MAHRVTYLSLSRSLVISIVLVLYQDTGQGTTITSCGFESDVCNYIQPGSNFDQFDWTRGSGATPTANTGPSSASKGRYYLYIETDRNNEGDKATFQTRGLKFTGTACVSLAYHMYGEDIGTFLLWRYNTPRLKLLNKTGNQGDRWIRYQARIDSVAKPTTLLMEGFKGSGKKGDIAIDDFSVVTGTCKTTVHLDYSCSFETDLCDMWQTGSDDLDWIRIHKSNPTPETGSPGDSSGDWIISLASDGQDSPEVGSIETPELNFAGDICVRFKYYLSSNVSALGVYREDADSMSLVYNDSAATGAIWQSVSLTVRSFGRYHWITFSGRFTGGQEASMALDEISISTQICDDCADNNGGCNKTCSQTDTGRTCFCRSGYIQYGETGCQDIDECAMSTSGCQQNCSNIDGSYNCVCNEGYDLTADNHTCTDINECSAGTHSCSDDCQNDVGSYSCSCPIGSFLQDDQRTCQACNHGYFGHACQSQCRCDVNAACDATSGICPSGCEAGWMTATCSIDINECLAGTHSCSDDCQNEVGSYSCSCPIGAILQDDQRICQVTLQPDVTGDEAAATTPGGLTTSDTPGSSLWKILAGVGLGSTVIMAVVVVVVVIIRRRRMTSPNDDHTVTYENGNVGISSAVTIADDPNNPPEAGVYQEINTTGYVNMFDMEPNPTVEYQNDVVYTKDPYQNLGSNREPLPDPYDTLKE